MPKINNHQNLEKCGTNSNNNCIDSFQQFSKDFFKRVMLCDIFCQKGQKLIKLFTAIAAVNVTRTIEETVSKLVYEKNLKKATAKKETEAKKTKELQKSMERYVKEKSSTKSIKKNPLVSAKPSPAPIKDDPTGERESRAATGGKAAKAWSLA